MRRLVLLAVLAGCTEYELGESEPVQAKEDLKDIPIAINRDLDILFVIDDSSSMAEEQASLAANFPAFIEVLETIEGGLPNVHIGVVSSNMGGETSGSCAGSGRDGDLLVGPWTCRPEGAPFLVDVATEDGGRTRNYPGTLAEAFTCNAMLGTEGCPYEQHLQAMRRALDGSNLENNGFLRHDAYLAVVFIADEDDCSIDGPIPTDCDCFDDAHLLYDVQEYVDFLKALKADPGMVLVSTIAGDPTPLVFDDDGNVVPSCISSSGSAHPALRLTDLAHQFPNRNTFTSICEEDLSDGMRLFAEMIKVTLGNPCLESDLVDVEPGANGLQFECVVSEVVDPGTNEQDETLLPYCSADGGAGLPCWHMVEDRASCPDTPTGLVLQIERSGVSVAPGTHVVARCLTE